MGKLRAALKKAGSKVKKEAAEGGVVGAVQKAAEGGPSMKSKVYMSGTSMGSGVNMKSGCTISKHMKGSGMNMSSSSRHDSGGPKMAPLVGMAIQALAPMVMGKIADELGKKFDK